MTRSPSKTAVRQWLRWPFGVSAIALITGVSFAYFYFLSVPTWSQVNQWIDLRFTDVPSISTSQLGVLIEQQTGLQAGRVLLLDVRTADEFAVSRLPGAIHAPADQMLDFAERELAPLNRSQPIVVYCSVGIRSAMAARDLQLAGFTNVKNLRGSIFQWANEGRPMQGGTQVHPYNRQWGKLLREDLRAPQSP